MWKKQAEALFFIEHMQIGTIASVLGVSRQSVSEYLNRHEGYRSEMGQRKRHSASRRKEYQREWVREKRCSDRYNEISGESMRREHDLAAMILSRERFF